MGYMTIDGRKVEFTDEPNVLSVIRNADIDIRHSATIQNCLCMEPVVCVP